MSDSTEDIMPWVPIPSENSGGNWLDKLSFSLIIFAISIYLLKSGLRYLLANSSESGKNPHFETIDFFEFSISVSQISLFSVVSTIDWANPSSIFGSIFLPTHWKSAVIWGIVPMLVAIVGYFLIILRTTFSVSLFGSPS